MWGEGYILPSGNAFELQFEPMGVPRENGAYCRCYHYRRRLEGRGVVVSCEEYDKIRNTFEGYVLRRTFLAIVIYFAISGPFFILEALVDFGSWSGVSLLPGLIPAIIYFFRQKERDWRRIDDSLSGRRKVGKDRSPEEAKIMRFALCSWTAIGACAMIVAMPTIAVFNGRYPQPHDWIWLGPLWVATVPALVWRSILKRRAIRYVERNWRRGKSS